MSTTTSPEPEGPWGEERGPELSRLALGLTLIAIGVAYTLDRLGYLEADRLWDYWPVALILAGAGKLASPGSSSSRFTGAILAGLGVWILLDNLDLAPVSFWRWWPVLLILLGLRLLLGHEQTVRRESVHAANAMAVMGGAVRHNSSAHFRGGDVVAFMGGCDLDLRGARIAESPAVIDAFAFWGGIDIKVPKGWRVSVKGIPLIGAYDDSTELEEEPGAPRQELVVKGYAIMGGVEIKN